MRGRFPDPLVVTEHFQVGRFKQVVVSALGRLSQPTHLFAPDDPNRAALQASNNLNRLILDDPLQTQNPDPITYARGGNALTLDGFGIEDAAAWQDLGEASNGGGHVIDMHRDVGEVLGLELESLGGGLPDAETGFADPELRLVRLVVGP